MKQPTYICFEGSEGCYKSTNVKALADFLRSEGYSVLETKEPGTPHIPLTMKLREIMLSNEFADQLTPLAREFISQAIRSIHIEKLIMKADVDYIIQDRGTLSGKAYAQSLGHSESFIDLLAMKVTSPFSDLGWNIYDHIIILENDVSAGLALAVDKKEYSQGDAMESMGKDFMIDVQVAMRKAAASNQNISIIDVYGKDRETVFDEILTALSFR